MKEDEERCQSAGCDAYIVKPLRYRGLYAVLDRLLSNHPGCDGGNVSESASNLTAPARILIIDDESQSRRLLQVCSVAADAYSVQRSLTIDAPMTDTVRARARLEHPATAPVLVR
jgi:CheY-like chemotaxis protein